MPQGAIIWLFFCLLSTQLVCRKPREEEWGVSVEASYLSGADGAGGKGPSPRGSCAGGKGLHAKTLSVLCLQVVLLGIDILSALVSRLQDRFKAQIGTGKGSVCDWGGGGDVALALLGSALAAVYKAGFLLRIALGRHLVVTGPDEGWEGLVPSSDGGRLGGLCHCDSFLLRDLDIPVFFPQCCQVYLIGWETLRTR